MHQVLDQAAPHRPHCTKDHFEQLFISVLAAAHCKQKQDSVTKNRAAQICGYKHKYLEDSSTCLFSNNKTKNKQKNKKRNKVNDGY